MNKKLIGILVLVLAALPISVAAQILPNNPRYSEAPTERKCMIVTRSIENITRRYDVKHPQYVARYQKLLSNLRKADERLTSLGYDTNGLKSKLAELNERIVKLAGMIKQLDATLQETQGISCGHRDGSFSSKVQEAHAEMKQIRENAKEIGKFVREEVRPAIQVLKSQQKSTD